jgi:molybdopterin converting factor small subunit
MKVTLFPSSTAGSAKEVAIEFNGILRVSELLEMLELKAEFIKPYIHKKGGRIIGFRFALVRGEEILRLDDSVNEGDTIKVLPPIAGG